MTKTLFAMVVSMCACISSGCNKSVINMAEVNDSYQCQYMKDICKESSEFEIRYQKMTGEEKKEMKNVLQAYRSQCSDAIQGCEQAQKK
jgi:hypothetical protein